MYSGCNTKVRLYKSESDDLMESLLASLSDLVLPKTIQMVIAERSISYRSPDRKKVVKVDVYKHVFVDKVIKGEVKSVRHLCDNQADTHAKARELLTAWIDLETRKIQFLERVCPVNPQ